jgi:hypothetical protein
VHLLARGSVGALRPARSRPRGLFDRAARHVNDVGLAARTELARSDRWGTPGTVPPIPLATGADDEVMTDGLGAAAAPRNVPYSRWLRAVARVFRWWRTRWGEHRGVARRSASSALMGSQRSGDDGPRRLRPLARLAGLPGLPALPLRAMCTARDLAHLMQRDPQLAERAGRARGTRGDRGGAPLLRSPSLAPISCHPSDSWSSCRPSVGTVGFMHLWSAGSVRHGARGRSRPGGGSSAEPVAGRGRRAA